MGYEGELPQGLEGVGPSFIEALYNRWLDAPTSVDVSWGRYFDGVERTIVRGPSWQRSNWPQTPTDSLTAALDPMQMSVEPKADAKVSRAVTAPAAPSITTAEVQQAAADSIRAMLLVRTYRVRGHLACDLDPLGLYERELPADLTPEWHGFKPEDFNRPIYLGGVAGLQNATVIELVDILRRNYCGKVGVEYMHINDVEERRFIQERIEGHDKDIQFSAMGQKAILSKVIEGEQFERYLAKKYVGTKRFGLDGGESLIPALESIIKYGGASGVREIVIGMPHRGRLNVLANVMQKPFRAIFHEFAGGSANPDDVGGSGDVKYHLGTSTDRSFDGIKVHLSLAPNPSHLEAVDPVVLGKVRAQQTLRCDTSRTEVLPVLMHGDAAFAGQGIVPECLGFSGLTGYNTGGCIHFIVNNQIGFTTSPQFARSSPYPSDVAKVVQAPIFHVNGDDPEAVTFVTKLATEFRQKFKRDVVIDMWCYRRFGHNESDEPSFTQPLMYEKIRKQQPISVGYAARLKAQGVIDDAWLAEATDQYLARLDSDFDGAKSYAPNKADWFEGRWSGLSKPADPVTARRSAATGVSADRIAEAGAAITTVPDTFAIHKTLARVIEGRAETLRSGQGVDWATAEELAFGTLLQEGYGIRLSGQDSGRGTFSQRHAVWIDQTSGAKYLPLAKLAPNIEVLDSPLSEFGVLGFEYGYALAEPKTLVLWEAQFGDFANGAQVIIDQFIASGEVKWLRANGLVMLLPHGYEGQGPEHSSARLERYLQLCAEDNLQIANCTTPSNYFHILRRQMLRPFRKPLIIMTPKSLLRHKKAVSKVAELGEGTSFHRVLWDDAELQHDKVRRVVLCSGKVYFDLAEARDKERRDDVAILRVEQLYPFPSAALIEEVGRFPNAETIVWAQEEPRNAGAWSFVESFIEDALGKRPVYAGRAAAAATATGLMRRHNAEQGKLVAEALGASKSEVNAAIRSGLKSRQKSG